MVWGAEKKISVFLSVLIMGKSLLLVKFQKKSFCGTVRSRGFSAEKNLWTLAEAILMTSQTDLILRTSLMSCCLV